MRTLPIAGCLCLTALIITESAAAEARPDPTPLGFLEGARSNAGGHFYWSDYVSPYPWLKDRIIERFESWEEFAEAHPEEVRLWERMPKGDVFRWEEEDAGIEHVTWPPDYAGALTLYEEILLRFPKSHMPPREIMSTKFLGGEPISTVCAPLGPAHRFYQDYFPRYPDLVCDVAQVEASICEKKLGRLEAAEKRLAFVAEKYEGVHYEPQDAIARTKISTDFTFIRPEEFARHELAVIRAESGRFDEAIAGFEEVIRRYPNCRLAYLAFERLASIFEKQGKLGEAASTLERKWAHIEEHWPVYMGGVCSLSDAEKRKIGAGLLRRARELRRRAAGRGGEEAPKE